MIYKNAHEWNVSDRKRVLLFGMSGVGKTHISDMLRIEGNWFHYSVDYRIGTRYMGEHIVNNFKREAMKNSFLANLLMTNSIYIASNITFNNLEPLSSFMGKPGDPAKGGLPLREFVRRQELHAKAEVEALQDTVQFITDSFEIYGYKDFVCDSGGSICEVVDPSNPEDPLLKRLSEQLLLVWIRNSSDHTEQLLRRFSNSPKPMYYRPSFFLENWREYCEERGVADDNVEPNDFSRWIYRRALNSRLPRYNSMSRNWGVEICFSELMDVKTPDEFCELIGKSIEKR